MGRGSEAGLSLFEAIGRLFEKGDAESGEAKISFLERLLAAMYGLAGIPIGIVDAVAALLDVIIRFIGNLKSADWNSVDNVSEFISTISASWTEAKDSSGAVEALGNWVDSMSNFVGTVNGLDVYGALDKAKTFADFIKTGFTTGEWEWPENLTTPELTITPTVTVVPYTGEGIYV